MSEPEPLMTPRERALRGAAMAAKALEGAAKELADALTVLASESRLLGEELAGSAAAERGGEHE